jgi:hypothetical protein
MSGREALTYATSPASSLVEESPRSQLNRGQAVATPLKAYSRRNVAAR